MSKHFLPLAATLFLSALSGVPAFAGQKTVILDVPSMNCPTCPITVKKSLERVAGVSEVKVTYEPKQAVVTYDDTKTSPEALTRATANAGYFSNVREAR